MKPSRKAGVAQVRRVRAGEGAAPPFSEDQRSLLGRELGLPQEYALGAEPYFLVLLCGAWGTGEGEQRA